MLKVRGFEKVSKQEYYNTVRIYHDTGHKTLEYDEILLPKRSTTLAAGYDLVSPIALTVYPGNEAIIPTCIKAYMQPGEMLALYPRSGLGFKYQICLANTVGIGDGDYYNCESNEGHYMLKLVNRGNKPWNVQPGDKIAQAIFQPILLADGDSFEDGEVRKGGFGSTDQKDEE